MRDSIAPEPRAPFEEPGTSTTAEQRDVNPDGFDELDWWLSADAPSADAGGPRREGPEAAGGEAVSITCLAPFTEPHTWQFLTCGIDSVDLSLGIEWGDDWETVSAQLEADKLRAAGSQGVLSEDQQYVIRPGGLAPSFRWHLEWPEFHLFLGKSQQPSRQNPNGRVAINSKALWSAGLQGVLDRVTAEITAMGGTLVERKPSRVDLAADFHIPADLSLELLLSHRVPSHVKHSQHLTANRLETFYQGAKGSTIQMRIYDKGLEVLQSGTKLWFLDVWKLRTFEHIWRVEFQVRRDALRELHIHTLEDLQTKLGGLWEYLTNWFSLRVPDNLNTSRRTLHPWWAAVAKCAEQFGDVPTLRRTFAGEPADSSWYVSHCAGCLAGFAACEGFNDLEMAATLLAKRMENYWRKRNFAEVVAVKSIRLSAPSLLGQSRDVGDSV